MNPVPKHFRSFYRISSEYTCVTFPTPLVRPSRNTMFAPIVTYSGVYKNRNLHSKQNQIRQMDSITLRINVNFLFQFTPSNCIQDAS